MKRSSASAKAAFLPPLFDRLTHEDVGLLDEEGLKASIQKEIALMLNTRSFAYKRQQGFLKPAEETLETYEYSYSFPELLGLSDFSFFDASNAQEWHVIELHMEASLAAFEPRLKNPSVKIAQFDPKKQQISLVISGEVVFGKRVESISFPLDFDLKNATHTT